MSLRRIPGSIDDNSENDGRRDESSFHRNSRNFVNTQKRNNSDDNNGTMRKRYSMNNPYLQKYYKPSHRLGGVFATKTSILQGLHRSSRDNNFRSINNNLTVRRFEVSTIEVDDVEEDPNARSHSQQRDIRSCLKKIPLANTAKQYFSNSTLHGLRYIGDASLTIYERIFWMIAFVIAVTSAGFFIMNLYKKWIYSPIIISMDPTPIRLNEFPFPSVTVCNMNKVQRTEATRINRGDDKLEKILLEDQCKFRNGTLNEDVTGSDDWERRIQFMSNVTQPCTDMVSVCKWNGYSTDCLKIFAPSITDEGICCTFNFVSIEQMVPDSTLEKFGIPLRKKPFDWNPEKGYQQSTSIDAIPRRSHGAGKSLGLTLILDSELEEYYCSSTASVGFKMFLHNPMEEPEIAENAFLLSPGTETSVTIKPQVTAASSSLLRVPKKKRVCYFSEERKLEYHRTYTQKNCLFECEQKFFKLLCGCVPFYMQDWSGVSYCGKKDDPCIARAKRAINRDLFDEEMTINEKNITRTLDCKCWPGCSELNYDFRMSSTKLASDITINDVNVTKSQEYFAKNMAVVHLFFAESQYPKYVKSELFGCIDFLSNIGGLLGLFMGFSFLSVVEMIYFVTLRVWCRFHERPG